MIRFFVWLKHVYTFLFLPATSNFVPGVDENTFFEVSVATILASEEEARWGQSHFVQVCSTVSGNVADDITDSERGFTTVLPRTLNDSRSRYRYFHLGISGSRYLPRSLTCWSRLQSYTATICSCECSVRGGGCRGWADLEFGPSMSYAVSLCSLGALLTSRKYSRRHSGEHSAFMLDLLRHEVDRLIHGRHCKPGGYFELRDLDMNLTSDESETTNNVQQWCRLIKQCYEPLRRGTIQGGFLV